MSTDHCAHCGDNCGDDHRAAHTFPQLTHTDEAGAFWRVGCCPACRAGDGSAAVVALAEQLDRIARVVGWDGADTLPPLPAYVASIVADRDMLRAEIGNVWEALPDHVVGEYSNVSDAVAAVLGEA